MALDKSDKVGEVASQIDELETTVEELKDDPPAAVDADTIDELDQAVHRAAKVSSRLEDQVEESDN